MTKKLHTFQPAQISSQMTNLQNSYHNNGIVHISDFINPELYPKFITEINQLVIDAEKDLKENWQNEKLCFYSCKPQHEMMNITDYASHPYFISSRNKAHVFYEVIDNQYAINRIGHGIHLLDAYPHIQSLIYHNVNLRQLLQMAGLVRPICHLSVYIPKYPRYIGSVVHPHQESSFAYTEPQSVVVLWIALENAMIENACMWGVLGSNHWPLKYLSCVNHTDHTRTFKQLSDVHIPDFETEREKFTPLEIKAGDALLFHGKFIHCSPVNTSEISRKALSFQFIDTCNVYYPETNWINAPNIDYLY